MPTPTRRNVYANGGDLNDPALLWYAKAVGAMKGLPLADPKSWRFWGAMHGFTADGWGQAGVYDAAVDPLPSAADQATYWSQCQHGTWYFLPWHRGYLYRFEQIVREQVVAQGGPADWTLPYWNYFLPGQSTLPPAFSAPNLPDGSPNPLYEPQRYGSGGGNIVVQLTAANYKAMNDPHFPGLGQAGVINAGFGGPSTGFNHQAPPSRHGGVELQPHDTVHGDVGGNGGLMSYPDLAALDPIFWLHHANIDRLWEVWRENPATHLDPTDANWLGGPPSTGGRPFTVPTAAGGPWTYTPTQVASLAALGYTYDDLGPAIPISTHGQRLQRLNLVQAAVPPAPPQPPVPAPAQPPAPVPVPPAPPAALIPPVPAPAPAPGAAMPTNVELVGASRGRRITVAPGTVVAVHLDRRMRAKVIQSLTPSAAPPVPDRTFLAIENVMGKADWAVIDIFIDAAGASDQAGSIGLFGIGTASDPGGQHGGQGISYSLEVTDIVDKLHLAQAFDVPSIDVRLEPHQPIPADQAVTIGRIALYRQGL